MRFYRLPLAEVLALTVKQLYFLGGRVNVYQAEDALSAIEVASFPYMKDSDRNKIIERFRAIISADDLRAGVHEQMDRAGLARLKEMLRGKGKK